MNSKHLDQHQALQLPCQELKPQVQGLLPTLLAAAWHTIEDLPPLSNFCRVPTQFELARTEQLEFTLTMRCDVM